MFLHASAIVCILTAEPEAYDLARRLEAARVRLTSGLAAYEASLAARTDTSDPEEQRRWKEGHDKLAARSTSGESIVVAESGHYIQVEQPSAVIAAVMKVVGKLRQ